MHEDLHLLTWQSCKVRVCSVSGHGPGMQEVAMYCRFLLTQWIAMLLCFDGIVTVKM